MLHDFKNDGTDGLNPEGSLVSVGSMLYGMTSLGGANRNGTVFATDTSGNVQVLYSFKGGSDGSYPCGSLVFSGTTLFGITLWGGASGSNGYGTIFGIGPDGNGYQVLHRLNGQSDGAFPEGSLVLDGTTLYGTAYYSGGAHNYGTIFQINTDGTVFKVTHNFAGTDGAAPKGSLLLIGSVLYGTTYLYGGSNYKGSGTVFQINDSGSGTKVLQTFNGTTGAAASGSLIQGGSTLYGMTAGGGSFGSSGKGGTIFSLTVTLPPTVPGAPTGVSATGGNASAKVYFTAPTSTGGSPITSYIVTPYIGTTPGKTTSGSRSPITVKNLTNGTQYRFTVAAKNKVGTGPASDFSNYVTPSK